MTERLILARWNAGGSEEVVRAARKIYVTVNRKVAGSNPAGVIGIFH